jgi:preprotein translocase subunit SecY
MEAIRQAFSLPDLRRRILFTLGILMLYRLLANIPAPGVDPAVLDQLANQLSGNALIDTLNLLSGGALTNFSVLAMGVYPYITASIIIQLLTPIVPYLEELSSEGQSGRAQINKITYYLTVPLAIVQAVGQVNLLGLQYGGSTEGVRLLLPYWGFTSLTSVLASMTVIFAMTAGTMFAVWLGQRITEEGIGQGVSLIIVSGIVTGIPAGLMGLLTGQVSSASGVGTTLSTAERVISLAVFVILLLASIYVIVKIQEGDRRLPVQYGRRVRGRKVYQGQSSTIPLKVNTAGMIPIIFAQSLLAFPGLIAQVFIGDPLAGTATWYNRLAQGIADTFGRQDNWIYWVAYFLLVFGFTFFYTDVMIKQQKMHENLQRQGGFIPGIRPGVRTEQYIKSVVRRITLVGATFLSIIAVVPGLMVLLTWATGIEGLFQSSYVVNGSALIIVVGVAISTMRQLESQLLMRNYEGFMP